MSENIASTKRIYFVRHGETDANVAGTVQPPMQELNENGLLQAEKIAERVANLSITAMFASDFNRAVQTADIIAKRNGLTYQSSELFREVATPPSLHGEKRTTDAYLKYAEAFTANLHDPKWHFESEENPYDVVLRCRKAKEFLNDFESTDILVVSHGLFLKYFVGHILLGDEVDPIVYHQVAKRLNPSNVGLTVCRVVEGEWNILTWNDHAHLAE